jgi:selenocysteine lyase/cysteine desulfurase
MSIDLAKVRADTPGVDHVVHFNNSGAALMPRPVLDALKHHLDREATIGGYEAEAEADALIEHSYDAVAQLINADRDEIAIVENATVAWDIAFYGLAQSFSRGDRILTAMAEYASNYIAYLQLRKRSGIVIDVVPNDDFGQLDVGALEAMIDDRVKLISVTHVPTNGGLVNPAAAIGTVARRHGIPYLLDACQSVGQMPIDVAAIGCDMLSATGRKYLRGPRGTGFLYVRRSLMDRIEPPFLDLRAATWTEADSFQLRPDARRFENWENYVAGKIGLGVAVDYALDIGLDAIYARIGNLAARMRAGLAACDGVTVTDIGREQCGIVTFRHDRRAAPDIVDGLRRAGINASASSRFSTLLDMQARGLDKVVRAPVHYYNSEQEVDLFLDRLERILRPD